MKKNQVILLILLSAIWGSSFMFMKVLSPVFGPVATASFRLLIGASVLLLYFIISKRKITLKGNVITLLMIGIIGLAIPYFCFAFAAKYIPSNLSAVLNSTSPMFSFIIGMIFLDEKVRVLKIVGLILGSLGVVLITGSYSTSSIIGILAVLFASFLYAVTGVIIKLRARNIDSYTIGLFSQIFGGLFLLPFITVFPIQSSISLNIMMILFIFGFFTSAVALLLYYKLMIDIGPTNTLTVTYIMPLFALIWGYIILNEKISFEIIVGGIVIIIGTILITKKHIIKTE